MFNLRKGQALLKRYRDDEGGNMALMFAISAVAVVGCMGAAMDFSTRSNAKLHSQGIADQLALAAAIYVKDNDAPPRNLANGYTEGEHTAADLGFDYQGFVDGGAANVKVVVKYDDTNKEATVTVSGATTPTFMQVLGKHDMGFSATSTVSYLQVDEMQPASIMMVLDNSGSMRWDDTLLNNDGSRPANSLPRIDRLKSSVTNFRTRLQARIGNQTTADGHRVLRTGIIPYNDQIINTLTTNTRTMYWGFDGVSGSQVTTMQARGGTNSNPPMKLARDLLSNEDDFHRDEAQRNNEDYREPIKFVVFMTDGQNTSGNIILIPGVTGYYYKKISGRWYYTRNRNYANRNGFQEGSLGYDTDAETLKACQDMKNQGVRVFTIGFALDPGQYYNQDNPSSPVTITEQVRTTAYSLLSQCASEPENFIIAGERNNLQSAFDQIQNAVVKELIRIKS